MKKIWLALLSTLLVFAVAGCGSSEKETAQGAQKKGTTEQITVSAAASLQDALNEIKDNFVKEQKLKPEQIAINYGGSGTLRRQLEQGAPSAVFISASERHMKALQEKDMMTDVKPLVKNSLVLIVPKGKEAYTFATLEGAKHISIGTPESVPAGKYAQQALQHMNLWTTLESKFIYAKDVRAVLAQVSQSAVDAGMVYKTDALQAKDAVAITATAPADSHTPIVYPVGIVKKNTNDLGKAFYNYLFTPESAKVFEKYGFVVH